MKIESISVRGFRPLRKVDLQLDDLTVLIGPNGSGKSSVLGALRLFFRPSVSLDQRDFWRGHDGTVEDEVTIRVTFSDLSPDAVAAFRPYLRDSRLVIERHFNEPGSGNYLAHRSAVPDFANVRNLHKGHRDEYNKLADDGRFEGLQRAPNKDKAFQQMAEWERTHPEHCEDAVETVDFVRNPAGQPTAVASYLRFLFVGAMEDPGGHLEPEGQGAVGELIKEAVDTSDLELKLTKIADNADKRAGEVLSSLEDAFAAFRDSIGDSLNQFAPGFSVNLSWAEMNRMGAHRPRIRASVRREDGFETDLEYQGHGIQRSLMYGVLTAQATVTRPATARTLMLALEEPETFQHPLSARVLANTLLDLANRGYQIIHSTHSPDMLNPAAIGGLRLVTRDADRHGNSHARVDAFDLDGFAARFGQAVARDDVTATTLGSRLEANLERRVLEGLFANACVLVEGEEDEALLRATCMEAGIHLDKLGIAIIQTRGKTGMPLVLGFLTQAGVPCYPVFDLDRNQHNERDQHREAETGLLSLQGLESATSLTASAAEEKYACFEYNIGATVTDELGPVYEQMLKGACDDLGYVVTQGRKVAPVLREALHRTLRPGIESPSLKAVAARIAEFGSN